MKRLVLLATVLALSTILAAQQPGLTTAQIEKPSADSWPSYNGDYSGRRFSPLTKVNAANVKHLSLAWMYDLAEGGGGLKATPLHVDGVLYFSTPDHAYAVESRAQAEPLQDADGVRGHVDAATDFGQRRRLLVYIDGEAGLPQRQSGAQTADAAADYRDLKRHR